MLFYYLGLIPRRESSINTCLVFNKVDESSGVWNEGEAVLLVVLSALLRAMCDNKDGGYTTTGIDGPSFFFQNNRARRVRTCKMATSEGTRHPVQQPAVWIGCLESWGIFHFHLNFRPEGLNHVPVPGTPYLVSCIMCFYVEDCCIPGTWHMLPGGPLAQLGGFSRHEDAFI